MLATSRDRDAEQKRGHVFALEISDGIIAANAMTLTYNRHSVLESFSSSPSVRLSLAFEDCCNLLTLIFFLFVFSFFSVGWVEKMPRSDE